MAESDTLMWPPCRLRWSAAGPSFISAPMNKAASHFIDAARWLATLLVALFHANNIFVNQADIMTATHNPLAYVWWFFINFQFGHEGLVMFFVFSGVLVGGPVIERMRKPQKFFQRYLIDRIVRIYIVLIPILAIGFCIDNFGRWIFAGAGVYELPHYAERFNAWLFLPTLASLQGIWFNPYGTNEPLWSLGMECWYYVIFPLLFLPLAAGYGRAARIAGCAFAIAAFLALAASGSHFAIYFVLWCAGAAARLAPRPLMRNKYVALVLWLAVLVAVRLLISGSKIDTYPYKIVADGLNTLLVVNLVTTLRFDPTDGFRFCNTRLHKFLADFSYSVYALHVPVLIFIWAATARFIGPGWRGELATLPHYLTAIGSVAFVGVLAFGLSRVTEMRTDPVRRFFHNLFGTPKLPARQEPAAAS